MALKASVAIENQDAIDRLLTDLGRTVERKIVRAAIRKGMKPMLAATKKAAPVDSGLLKKSLVIRSLKQKRGRPIAVQIGFKNVAQIVERSTYGRGFGPRDPAKKKKRQFYPAVVEYGSKTQSPHPYMRPAFDSTKDQSISTINKEVRLGIETWAARNANK